jgi:hypothetical protein
MKSTIVEKLDALEEAGKITHEQRLQLEKEYRNAQSSTKQESISEEESEFDPPSAEFETNEEDCQTSFPVLADSVMVCKCIDEDIEIVGDPNQEQIEIRKGRDLVDVRTSGTNISIKSKKNLSPGSIFTGRRKRLLQILVPTHIAVTLKTVSGDLRLHNLSQNILAKSVSGDIQGSELDGLSYFETISGDIELDAVQKIEKAITKSGDIEITNSSIQGQLKCFSGDIQLENTHVLDSEISTFSGDISLKEVTPEKTVYLKTFSGDLYAHLFTNGGTIVTKETDKPRKFIDLEGYERSFSGKPVSFGNGTDVELIVKIKSGDEKIRLEEN